MLDTLRSVLAKPPSVHPVLLWIGLVVGVASLIPLLLMLGYNLAAPLFHTPSMTYAESGGLCILASLLVGVIAILKE